MLVSATALIEKNQSPSEDEVMDALGGVLCRCTGYRKIIDAVRNAAPVLESSKAKSDAAVGRRLARLDAAAAWIARTGIGAAARLERYAWPIPSLPAADFATLTPSGPGLVPRRRRSWTRGSDHARRDSISPCCLRQYAADAILSGAAEAPRRYARRVREDIGADLGRAARVKELFFRPRFTRLLIDALQHSAGIRSVMADLVAGRQGYAGLKWRAGQRR